MHESFGRPQQKLDSVHKEIVDELHIVEKLGKQLKIDIELIAQAGYYAGFADRSQISDDDILGGRVVFASANFAAVKSVVSTVEKRAKVEKILDDAGFEHLITVRLITYAQTWHDFF